MGEKHAGHVEKEEASKMSLRAEIASLKKKCVELEEQINELNVEKSALSKSCKDLRQNLELLTSENEEVYKAKVQLEMSNKESQQKLESLQNASSTNEKER